ncbi:ABC transporter substrate-binding protein [Actinocrispum wychmicini]|uniref:Multiple sugar transport system substrate-binding protein n=1 Tax=Actinocrispum wychmicini TaxID=1213861 RepID=A0A4R2J951_9PSEU|nr:sugar ABC transporter substrate-binding protein [Actinocrispum wychmicini]TCO54757.1 multiple sugar transport system substrate-binding protein [Actinocrispum wychmicini]
MSHPVPGMNRRGFLQGALAAAALPLVASCGGGSTGDAKELTFWNFYGPNEDGATPQSKRVSGWFTQLAADWNANNDVKVKPHYIPVAEYINGSSLQTAFSAGQGPDIFVVSPGDFMRYYNGGVLQDLTPHLSAEAKADFRPGVLENRMVDGKVYGLPMEIEPLAMFYSVQAFESAGLSEADIPTTWDQLLNVAEKLTTNKRFGLMFETTPGYYQNFTWYPFMWMGGGSAVNGNKSGFDSPATVQALKLWQDVAKRGLGLKKPAGDGGGDVTANMVAGLCAMQQTGIWSVSDLTANAKDFKYGVFPLPTPPNGKGATDMGGWAFVANAKGGNPEAAAKFITWALGSTDQAGVERQRQWNTVIKTNLPPRLSVSKAAEAQGAFATPVLATFANKIAPAGRPEPRYPAEIYQAVSDAIQASQLGGADPAKAAADASAKIDSFLQGYQGAPII